MSAPDFTTANCGNMIALTPTSEKANQAIADGVIDFENWQAYAGSIMVDHRTADDLIANLERNGFTIAPESGQAESHN